MRKWFVSLLLAIMLLGSVGAVQQVDASTGWHVMYYTCDYADRLYRVDGYYVQQVSSWGYYDAGPYQTRRVFLGYC